MFSSMILPVLSFLALGCFAGILSGLLGIGGGLVVVPGLLILFRLQNFPPHYIMHMAIGTSLAVMSLTTQRALQLHLRMGAEVWLIYRQFVGGIVLGTISGVLLATQLHSNLLSIIFAIFIFIISLQLLFAKPPNPDRRLPGSIMMNVVGSLVGFKSGLLGVGGGALSIPFLIYCNVSIRHAVGISAAISMTVAVIGSISFIITGLYGNLYEYFPKWSFGFIYWPAWLLIAIASFLTTPLGVRLSHRLPTQRLKQVFAIFLLLVCGQMLMMS